ncbi:hypothetical protein KBZ21_55905, partial [Streptomyces sp. A73]|nr:hypothetical protein [Streptomyces sp. A73]
GLGEDEDRSGAELFSQVLLEPLTEKAGLIDEGRSSVVNDERERRLVGAVRPLNFGQLKDLQPGHQGS